MKRHESGQVLVLFALSAVVLLGFAALAIDVSRAYTQERYQRTVSDAAALAGAQDLFQADSLDPPAGGPARAVTHAMDVLRLQLGATGPASCSQGCPLPGTPYKVWITTPSPTCVTCDPARSVQVTLVHPAFPLSFANLFGQGTWNISTTSVAGLTRSIRYALVALRPSYSPSGRTDPAHDQNLAGIDANGQTTQVNILSGDVGTNTSLVEQLTLPCALTLNSGFSVYHLSTYDTWCRTGTPPAPRGILIQEPIQDPGYVSSTTFAQVRDWLADPLAVPSRRQSYKTQHDLGAASCAGVTGAPSVSGLTTICYKPGYYAPATGNTAFSVNKNELAYLLPGTYLFNGDVTIQGPSGGQTGNPGMLVGGNDPKQPGVALLFPTGAKFSTSAGVSVSLNMGGAGCHDDTCRATAPTDTPYSPLVGVANLPLTIVVQRIDACFTGLVPTNGNCTESNVVNLAGGAGLAVAGIVYAPSDHVTVGSENGAQTGTMGQIISWWVTYTGNTALNQSYPGPFDTGVLRIDAACTKGSPVMPCNAP